MKNRPYFHRKLIKNILIGIFINSILPACGSLSQVKMDQELKSSSISAQGAEAQESDRGNALGLASIHFKYNSHQLTEESKLILKKNARILRANPNLKIQIEGHCDQKGTIAYNLVLGEKRALEVSKFLVQEGVKGSSLFTISYGMDRPLDPAKTDEAGLKNRRANFTVLSV